MKFFETSEIDSVAFETHRNSQNSILKFFGGKIMSQISKFLVEFLDICCGLHTLPLKTVWNFIKFHEFSFIMKFHEISISEISFCISAPGAPQ